MQGASAPARTKISKTSINRNTTEQNHKPKTRMAATYYQPKKEISAVAVTL
jgi:NH3-dependent NAD+ synthetase